MTELSAEFYPAKSLELGKQYLLTEYVEGKRVTSGAYYLVLVDGEAEHDPPLGFAKSPAQVFKKPRPPKVDLYLKQAHCAFGSRTWRHAFKGERGWELYWPAGGETWNFSYVTVEDVASVE